MSKIDLSNLCGVKVNSGDTVIISGFKAGELTKDITEQFKALDGEIRVILMVGDLDVSVISDSLLDRLGLMRKPEDPRS